MKNILIIDIETTGFLGQRGSIIEIGIVSLDLDTGKILELFTSLLREETLTEKHTEPPFGWIFNNSDLTIESVTKAPRAENVFPLIQEILNGYPIGCTAFNNRFDFDFLRDRGLKIKGLPCLMKLSTGICKIPSRSGGYKWPNVEEAFKHFFPDIKYTGKHRGLDDAKHEAMIAYELYKIGSFRSAKEMMT